MIDISRLLFFNAGSHQIGQNKRNAEIKDLLREIMALGESGEPIVNVQRFDAEIRNSVQFLDVSALCLLFPIFIFFLLKYRSNLMLDINSMRCAIDLNWSTFVCCFSFHAFYSMEQTQQSNIAEKIKEKYFWNIKNQWSKTGYSYVLYHFVMIQLVCVCNGQKVKK